MAVGTAPTAGFFGVIADKNSHNGPLVSSLHWRVGRVIVVFPGPDGVVGVVNVKITGASLRVR